MTISSRRGGAAAEFRPAPAGRGVVAGGAIGTRLAGAPAAISDFGGGEGCSQIPGITWPGMVRSIQDGDPEAGADGTGTNTFGVYPANPGQYSTGHPAGELPEAGARSAREATGVLITYHPEARDISA